jgi:two-component system, sensor histidine kinase and response regulator
MIDRSQDTILIVEDDPATIQILRYILETKGYQIHAAESGPVALETVKQIEPQLILLDVMLPEMDGYQVCEQLKADERTQDIPIIFISALTDTFNKIKGFNVGGADYITKPFHSEEVLARAESQLTIYHHHQHIKQLHNDDVRYYEQLTQLKDEFTHAATHDLKSPLAVIMGYIHLMAAHPDILKNPELEMYTQEIIRASDRMMALVDDLLEVSRLETRSPLNLEAVVLEEFLYEHVQYFNLLAQNKQIKVHYTPPPSEITIRIDHNRMGQVLSNLLSNAVKYTPRGGQVYVSTEVRSQCVFIRVADTGFGIPEDDLDHIFERFYRVNRQDHQSEEGTGLGLSIVKAIVEQHSGEITVESEVGAGSVFTVILPQSRD